MANKQKPKKKDFIVKCVLVLFVALFGFSAFRVMAQLSSYRKAQSEYQELNQFVTLVPPSPEEAEEPASSEERESGAKEEARQNPEAAQGNAASEGLPNIDTAPQIDFEALQKINSDIVGWVYVGGTQISYPIVQGTDNERYLNYTFTGEKNAAGSIFMDYRNQDGFLSENAILYGHNMKNKSMFAQLLRFKNRGFYNNHKYVWIATPEGSYRYEIFSAHVCSVTEDIYKTDFVGNEFSAYFNWVKSLSGYDTGVEYDENCRIITLSTCTNVNDAQRYVVQAKYSPQ